MSYTWQGIGIGQLVPALDKNNENSLISKAQKTVADAQSELNDKYNMVLKLVYGDPTNPNPLFRKGLAGMKQEADEALSELQAVLNALPSFGVWVASIKDQLGPDELAETLTNAVHDQSPDGPQLTDLTAVSAFLVVIAAPIDTATESITRYVYSDETQINLVESRRGYRFKSTPLPTVEELDSSGNPIRTIPGNWTIQPNLAIFVPTFPSDIQGKEVKITYTVEYAAWNILAERWNQIRGVFKGIPA